MMNSRREEDERAGHHGDVTRVENNFSREREREKDGQNFLHAAASPFLANLIRRGFIRIPFGSSRLVKFNQHGT